MRKIHILVIISLFTVFFAAGLLLFPQLKNGGEKTAGYALARMPARAPVPVVTALATTLCIWIGFEVLLRYELYRGILTPG